MRYRRAILTFGASPKRIEAWTNVDSERTKPYACLDSMRALVDASQLQRAGPGGWLNDGTYQICEEEGEELTPCKAFWDR